MCVNTKYRVALKKEEIGDHIFFSLCSLVRDESGARSRYGLRRGMLRVCACRMGMFGTSKVVLVIFLFSLINCTQGLSMFGLRNF